MKSRYPATLSVISLCSLFSASSAEILAQSVIAPAPQTTSAGVPGRSSTGTKQSPMLSEIASALPGGLPLLKRGPVSLRPRILYRFLHAIDMPARPLVFVDTSIQEFSPALVFEIGQHFTLNYAPTWMVYSHELFRDTFDQSVSLVGSKTYKRWTLGFSEAYTSSNPTLIETGGQTAQTLHSTDLTVSYRFGQRTLLQSDLSRSDRRANADDENPQWTTADWVGWSSSSWLKYQHSPKIEAGLGLRVGYDSISTGPDMKSFQPQAQFTWRPTDKVTLDMQGGLERRTVGSDERAMNNPIYSGSIEYQLLATTTLSASASRSVSASYFANRATRTLGENFSIKQRLLQRFYLTGEVAERRIKYLVTGLGDVSGVIVGRDDVSRWFTARLTTTFLQRGSLGLLVQHGRNHSSATGFSFDSQQYGAEFTYQF
jgi:hypothetical protein